MRETATAKDGGRSRAKNVAPDPRQGPRRAERAKGRSTQKKARLVTFDSLIFFVADVFIVYNSLIAVTLLLNYLVDSRAQPFFIYSWEVI